MKIFDVPQSGTTGQMVSYKTRFGIVRRRYVIPRDPRTDVQMVRRKTMGRARFFWRKMTDQQRAAWAAALRGIRSRPRAGQSGVLSPYLLSVKVNCNLALVGRPFVMDPPPQPRFAASPVGPLTITNTKDALAIQLSVSGKPAQFILVLGTKPRSAGVAYVDHFTILGVLPAPIRGLSDITDMFVAKYGEPPPGSRVFIQTMQVIDGWQDLPIQTCALVPEA